MNINYFILSTIDLVTGNCNIKIYIISYVI